MPFNTFAPGTTIATAPMNQNWQNAVHLSDQQKVLNKIMAGVVVNDADVSSPIFDMSSAGGDIHVITIAGNRTFDVSGVSVGQKFFVVVIQDATGSRVPTWWTGIKWRNGVAPVLSTAPGSIDMFAFVCISSGVYIGVTVDENLS